MDREEKNSTSKDNCREDYVFRFRLDETGERPKYDDAFTEMVRRQLAALLDIVFLTRDGRMVKVDGFKFINDPENNYEIFHREENHPVGEK